MCTQKDELHGKQHQEEDDLIRQAVPHFETLKVQGWAASIRKAREKWQTVSERESATVKTPITLAL